MDQQLITRLNKTFEEAAYEQNGIEYWLARDLQILLEYEEWRNLVKVIEKAKISCANAGQNQADHFVDVNKMVNLGSGSQREIADIMLTRYACYLIAWMPYSSDISETDLAFVTPSLTILNFSSGVNFFLFFLLM